MSAGVITAIAVTVTAVIAVVQSAIGIWSWHKARTRMELSTRLEDPRECGGGRLVITNTGAVDLFCIDIKPLPSDAPNLNLARDEYLPIARLKPGEDVGVPATLTSGGGSKMQFEVTVTGARKRGGTQRSWSDTVHI